MMLAMAAVAAVVNLICLRMLQRTEDKDVSMRAATTFSFNDFIANGGIIIAGRDNPPTPSPCTETQKGEVKSDIGIIIAGVGIIIAGLTGIIIAGATDEPVDCGIIIAG